LDVPEHNDDRLEALSEALARLVRNQRQIDARLLRIEAALQLPPPVAEPASPNTVHLTTFL